METKTQDQIREVVRERYGKLAQADSVSGGSRRCCGAAAAAQESALMAGYSQDELAAAPAGANLGLGCGNPQAIAALEVGDTVLDLGSGAGFDCFLAAGQVGDNGRVIGVDMTPGMITKARANAESRGIKSVEFRLGEIENLPVADGTIDVIISNCVINLSPDKLRVFGEAFRVLRPGGRLAISDIVAFAELPESLREDMELYAGCIAGAATLGELLQMLETSGFKEIRIVPKDESRSLLKAKVPGMDVSEHVASATIEATKPDNG